MNSFYALKLGLDQVNNCVFNIGADPKKLALHGTTVIAVKLITTSPIFTGLTTLAGAACGGALTALTSNLRPEAGALFGGALGAIVGLVGADLTSTNIAQSLLGRNKTPSITNEEALSLAKIRIAELAALTLTVAGLAWIALAS